MSLHPQPWPEPSDEITRAILAIYGGRREVVTLRDADTDGLPPGRSRIVSPYDVDARWGGKRDLV